MAAPAIFHFSFILTTACAIITTTSFAYARRQSDSGCMEAERAALLSFKAGIKRDPVNRLGSWKGQDCCRWNGVQCSNRTGHVVKLDLSNTNPRPFGGKLLWCLSGENPNGLHGKISPSLIALQHLKYLDLSGNYLGGVGVPIPKFIGSLRSLTHLDLSCMNFAGTVPPQLGNISRLLYLDLKSPLSTILYNDIMYSEDISWLSHLRSLRFLDMSGVNISNVADGDWVRVVTLIPSLKVLRLRFCNLRLPHESIAGSNISSLETLDLMFNNVDTLDPAYWFWDAHGLKELDLFGNQITGPFPVAIGNLTSLEMLSLGHNYLSGIEYKLPDGLCNLRSLELSSNNINQDLVEFLDLLPSCTKSKLQFLDLSDTNLTGEIPKWIYQWSNLSDLFLSTNGLQGSVPLEIGKLAHLKRLYLNNNQFTGSISEAHLTNLENLEELDLSYNSLYITISSNWLPQFSLQYAYFARCKIGPHFPLWLEGQINAIHIDISDAGIVDHLPFWFWRVFSQVQYLNISSNKIKGRLPETFEIMSSVQMLDLSSNSFTGLLPKLPKSLVTLDISKNSLSGPLPQKFGAPMLSELILSANHINGTIPTYICQLKYLQMLDLSENLLVGQIPQCSKGKDVQQKLDTAVDSIPAQLSILILYKNNLSGNFPELLKHSPQLKVLDLGHNTFAGELPAWIAEKCPDLLYLLLQYNMFSGPIPLELTGLGNIQIFDLAHNRISGTIPRALANLKAMAQKSRRDNPLMRMYVRPITVSFDIEYSIIYDDSLPLVMKGQELHYTSTVKYMVELDLSCNNLVGEIPGELVSLVGLINLNISHNQLSGVIPEKIGLLRSLESLDLSFNGFSGEIPWSLSDITSLSHLNLSYNNLSGRIPSGNQLQTLSDPVSMYFGNNYLCGPPLSRNCSKPDATEDYPDGNVPNNRDFLLGQVVGYVMGLWMVFVIFLFLKTWRVAYFQMFDNLQDKIHL